MARSPLRRAYDATYGRLFAATYDAGMARAERGELGRRRAATVAGANGRTLELGAGTGLNLQHYGAGVTELALTEPFGPMARRLRERVSAQGAPATRPSGGFRSPGERSSPLDIAVVEASAEALPFAGDSFDTVVCTLVLCTVDSTAGTLAEVARVLRPGGSLLFLEHVRAETPRLARAQDLLRGPWFAFGHGCHCNRDTAAAIEASPLEIVALERKRIAALPPIVRPVIAGRARLH